MVNNVASLLFNDPLFDEEVYFGISAHKGAVTLTITRRSRTGADGGTVTLLTQECERLVKALQQALLTAQENTP